MEERQSEWEKKKYLSVIFALSFEEGRLGADDGSVQVELLVLTCDHEIRIFILLIQSQSNFPVVNHDADASRYWCSLLYKPVSTPWCTTK